MSPAAIRSKESAMQLLIHEHSEHNVFRTIRNHALRNAETMQVVDRWQSQRGHAWTGDLLCDSGDCVSVEVRKARRQSYTDMV